MLAVVPSVAIGAVIYGRRVRRLSREVQDAVGHAAAVGEESLVGIRTVRAFAAEPTEARRYGDAVGVPSDRPQARDREQDVMGVAMFAAMGAAALVMWYGGGRSSIAR
jgi:ATP-binding cassette subfamily B protein